jgi:uncharacterized small protein (DUF1192 family)
MVPTELGANVMPDLSAIGAALTSFNTLKNIAQTMIGLHDTQALQAKVIEFNSAIIDAQTKIFLVNEERSALLERIGALEKEIADLEAWEATKDRYELKKTKGGGLAWFLKGDAQGSELPHQICTKCYEERKRSILQPKGRSGPEAHLGIAATLYCPACKSEILA